MPWSHPDIAGEVTVVDPATGITVVEIGPTSAQIQLTDPTTDDQLTLSVTSTQTLITASQQITVNEPLILGLWQTLTLLNGWTASTEVTNQFKGLRVVYLSNGMARLEGRIFAPGTAPPAGQSMALLPTGLAYPTVPDHTVQEQVLCTGNTNGITAVLINNHADGANVAFGAYPAGVSASAILVVDCMFYVGNGTTS